MPSDPRDELLRQIRSIRRRVDPDVLTRAAAAASTTDAAKAAGVAPAAGPGTGPNTGPNTGEVRLDMSWAKQAVELFLRSRNDGGRFAMQLMERMRRPEEAAKAYRDGMDPERPKPRVYRKLS